MPGRIVLYFMLFLLPAAIAEAAPPTLERISRESALASTRLRLKLSQATDYKVRTSGARIDILLAGAEAAPALVLPPEDDKIVRVTLARSKKELMVSVLLRRVPARVHASARREAASVQVDFFWEESKTRPPIAFRVSGLPARGPVGVAPPRLVSPYEGRWGEFFREYQTPLKWTLPVTFSFLPRPAEGEEGVGRDLSELLAAERWKELLETLRTRPLSADRGVRQRLALLKGEALLRTGKTQEALELLAPLAEAETPAPPAERTIYLHALAAAKTGDPYLARYQLSRLSDPSGPWVPLLRLLRAEVALAIGKPAEALEALDEGAVPWPLSAQPVRELRMADALAVAGRLSSAGAIYKRLLVHPELLMEDPFSLRACADTLGAGGEYEKAAFLYRVAARKIPRSPEQGLGVVAAARALEAGGDRTRALGLLTEMRGDFPGSAASHRARLRLLDHDVLSGDELRRRTAEAGYIEVAERAPLREIREEAAFKRALLLYLNGDLEKSAQQLISFSRDFAAGPLRPEAGILLREMVPTVVRALIASGEDLQALVLIEQSRTDLLAGRMNLDFLLDVAKASARLGLLQRASRVYLYLIGAPGDEGAKEPFYTPLMELALVRGEHGVVEEFGRRYLKRYPRGAERATVYLLRARALDEGGKLAEAAALLRAPGRPRTVELDLYAADLFWRVGDYRAVAGCFVSPVKAPPRGALLKAEALTRIGDRERALPLFRELIADNELGDQAAFRAAEIELAVGRRPEGLKLLRGLAEKGKNPLWRRLAGETLAVEKL